MCVSFRLTCCSIIGYAISSSVDSSTASGASSSASEHSAPDSEMLIFDIGGVNNFTDVVTPVSGRVRNLVIHASVPVDVETNFALRVNGVAPTSAPNYVLPVDARDESGTSMPIRNVHDVYVVAGDRLDVLSGGEMSPASVSSGGIWIEPMEGAN